jgi:hypothetical protein
LIKGSTPKTSVQLARNQFAWHYSPPLKPQQWRTPRRQIPPSSKPPTLLTTILRGKSGADSQRRDRGEVNADGDGEEYEDEEELDGPAAENEKINAVFQRLSSAPVAIRVHEIIIKGNSKTRDALIEAEVTDLIRSAATVQDLVRAASLATGRLRDLDVFDSVHITLDAGPPELPGTTTVVVQVVETANPISGSVGCLTKA